MRSPVIFCKVIVILGLSLVLGSADSVSSEPPDNLRRESLVAWCIAPPWDAKNRGPAERAELVVQLGLKRVAFNWRRGNELPDFEEEILQYKKHGIEFFAFWNEHEKDYTKGNPIFKSKKNKVSFYKKFVARMIRSRNGGVFVAQIDDKLVGHTIVEITKLPPIFVHEKEAHVHEIYVEKKYRKKGIGTKLLSAANVWAKENIGRTNTCISRPN